MITVCLWYPDTAGSFGQIMGSDQPWVERLPCSFDNTQIISYIKSFFIVKML